MGGALVNVKIPSNNMGDPGANGVMKRTALNTSAIADANDLSAPHYAAAGGTGNAITVTLAPVLASYATGATYAFKASAANTGAATVNINGLGAKTIKKWSSGALADLAAGDIASGQVITLAYDGTYMQIIASPPTPAGLADPGANGLVKRTALNATAVSDANDLGAVGYALAGGTADALTVTLAPAITSYQTGVTYRFKTAAANTGAATVDINGLGAKTVKKLLAGALTDLAAGDMASGQVVTVAYDGTYLQMQTPVGTGFLRDPGSNGPIKRTANTTTAPATANDLTGVLYAGIAGGTANALTGTLSPAIASYQVGAVYSIRSTYDNSSYPVTLNLNGLGAVEIRKMSRIGLDSLAAGDIIADTLLLVSYTGSYWQLLSVDAGLLQAPVSGWAATGILTRIADNATGIATQNDLGALGYALAGGSANALTVDLSPPLGSYQTGVPYQFKATATNTGAATVNISSLGAKTVKKYVAGALADLAAGDIVSGQVVTVVYDGTYLQMETPVPTGNIFVASINGTFGSGNQYFSPGVTATSTRSQSLSVLPRNGIFRNLYVYVSSVSNPGFTINVYLINSGGLASLSVTIPSSSSGPLTLSDTVTTYARSAGDLWGFAVTPFSFPYTLIASVSVELC